MEHKESFQNLKEKALDKFITEYDEPHYDARELYDRRASLKKTNFALRRFLKFIEEKAFDGKGQLELDIAELMRDITTQVELIRFTKSTDGISDETDAIFTGVKAVWYDVPLKTLIKTHYQFETMDINDFYRFIENQSGDKIDTGAGVIDKNLALQFIQALRLIVSGTSTDRYNRGIFRIHHDLQIAPPHVVDILELFGHHCEPTCVMKKSESEFEKGDAPKWIVNLADKPYERDYSVEELTEEEKRVFANAGKTKSSMIVIEGGCTCHHTSRDHYHREGTCSLCECSKFIKRMNTKRTIEV